PSLLAPRTEEIQHAVLFIDPQQLSHNPLAGRNLVLKPSGPKIVQIEMSPIVALGEPDNFIRSRKIPPINATGAPGLVLSSHGLLEHITNRSRRGLRNTELRALVIARHG